MGNLLLRLLLCLVFLGMAITCVATPMPIPPSIDIERLKLNQISSSEVELRGESNAIIVEGIRGVRVASPASWNQTSRGVDGAFTTVLGGRASEVFFIEGLGDDGDLFLAAVTGSSTPGEVVFADSGPDGDGDGWPDFIDCAPEDRLLHDDCPCTVEACNGRDDDCDGDIDEGCTDLIGLDLDGDGYTTPDDCEDFNHLVHPGAPELCNGLDDDCDGSPEFACAGGLDQDEDGFDDTIDCDDADPWINPDADEVCNGIDEDCNDEIDDACRGVCRSTLDCGWGECRDGACLCPEGRTICAYQCVDTETDSAHCGGCGIICTSGSCISGHCD